MAYYEAEWSGCYPTFCSGTWTLKRDGEVLDIDIPFNGDGPYDRECANTYGTYMSWHFDEDWQVIEEEYEDGLDMAEWIVVNEEWLASFAPREDWPAIYDAFSYEDWRRGSCGGCI